MKMRDGLIPVMALGLGLGAGLTGCGMEKTTEQPGVINKFGYGLDSQLWDKKWVPYVDELSPPTGEVRNLQVDEEGVLLDCVAVGDGYYSFDTDDDGCGGLLGDGSDCDAGEHEHCKAIYANTYSYLNLEPYVVEDCRADIRPLESKPTEPVENKRCEEDRRGAQWVEKSPRYIVWLSTTNPDFDEEEPDKTSKILTGEQEITSEEWQLATRRAKTTVFIRGGNIIDVQFE